MKTLMIIASKARIMSAPIVEFEGKFHLWKIPRGDLMSLKRERLSIEAVVQKFT